MCKGENCPLKENCYRYRAYPSECLQSYFINSPFDGEKCEYFISINGWKKLRNCEEIEKKHESS